MFGHNYFGPGNSVNKYKNPIDNDDIIALIHDWSYVKANTKEEILSADEEAIKDFFENWKKDTNYHSLFGGIALYVKNKVENIIGVQYPRMDRTTHRGHKLYANRMKAFSDQYKEYKRKHPDGDSWNAFRKRAATGTPSTASTTGATSSTGHALGGIDFDFNDIDWSAMDMQIDDIDIPVNNAVVDSQTGGDKHGGSSSGGAPLTCVKDFVPKTEYITYSKHRTQFSWGYTLVEIPDVDGAEKNKLMSTTTPMALIPSNNFKTSSCPGSI